VKKLTDLNARFLPLHGSDGKCLAGVELDCPCGHPKCVSLFVPFKNPIGVGAGPYGEKGWERTGDTIERLTLRPSVQRVANGPYEGDDHFVCSWHGYITDGEARTC
jgi:hypothetical protein